MAIFRTKQQQAVELSKNMKNNFPACKLFLPCDYRTESFIHAGEDAIYDAVTNSYLPRGSLVGSQHIEKPDVNTVKFTGGTGTLNFDIPPITLGTDPFLFFFVGSLTSTIISTFGISSVGSIDTNITFGPGVLGTFTVGGQNILPTVLLTSGAEAGFGMAFKASANEGTVYKVTKTAWTTPNVLNNDSATGAGAPIIYLGYSTLTSGDSVVLKGAALFSFSSGYPSDIQSALEWMTGAWLNGYRGIYPGWVGKA